MRDSGAEGTIPGGVTFLQAQLAGRLGELSKDKEHIIHGNTGILAGMSLKTLQDNLSKSSSRYSSFEVTAK